MGLISQPHSQSREMCVCVCVCVCTSWMNKEMPYYIRRPTLFFTNELVYPVSRSHNTKMRIAANSAKFYVYQQAPAASEQCLHSFTGKARLHPGGFNSIYFFESFDTSAQWRTEEGWVWGVQNPPPKFRSPSKIVPNSTRFEKIVKNCWI